MADTLGIHLVAGHRAGSGGAPPDGPDEPGAITAVRFDAAGDAGPTIIPLGDDGPADACAVVHTDDGAVLVGAAAVRAGGGTLVTDPLSAAAVGRIGALGSVINHVVGRAATIGDTAPRRVAVVVPDHFDVAARDRVVAAGAAAGVADTVAVPVSAAVAARVDVDPAVALAAGAARVASLAASPIVTREDLGESIETRGPGPVPPVVIAPPVSVFDEPGPDDAESTPTARPAPEPGAAAPAPPVTPAAGPPPVPPVGPPPAETLRYEPPRRRVPIALVVVVVLLALGAAIGGAIVLLGDDDTTDTTVPSTTTPTTTAPTTTAATTTEPATTSTSSTTTASTTTTSTTTSTTTTTTTTPVAVGEPGVVTLVETGLRFDDGGLVLFDQDAEIVIAELGDRLGEPDRDGGYEVEDYCMGSRSRIVRWGHLELVFTEDELDSGVGRFTQWYADGADDPEGLVTISGVGVTGTVGLLQVRFGESLVLVEAIEGQPEGLFAVTNPASGGVLNGVTTSLEVNGIVTALWAGDSCTRIFT